MTTTDHLTNELARALGLPRGTTRAVLTLQVGELPTMELSALVINRDGLWVIDTEREVDGNMVQRLASVQFMVRLEPFDK